ncbi:ABC-type transport auxiliary lipoprotein family protein [Gilliamella sp. wkB112]|uniref:ABC-type transport auxiliary lipoprotein family protein n=1 Tax=Gilliamella sp. wkB112 TaxID=3120257 RepID=UPI00080E3F9A|nr:ABC-type transport auxiliary lipoprotein family protein [Gilliamella apicola]OCG02184.1 hypothetical protein A9G12_10745 [Gilliamella apicola]
MIKIIPKFQIVLCVTLFTLLIGCSSNKVNKSYYQLANNLSNQNQVSQTMRSTNQFMWIESIDVASFLNKSGIVLQTENIKYATATNNLWVASLSQQLKDRLEQDLTALLPNYLVSSNQITTPSLTVKLFIDGFHGSYTGDAIIEGRWVVTDSKNNIKTKAFARQVPLTDNGYDALVKALSKGWQDEEQDFANSIKH